METGSERVRSAYSGARQRSLACSESNNTHQRRIDPDLRDLERLDEELDLVVLAVVRLFKVVNMAGEEVLNRLDAAARDI